MNDLLVLCATGEVGDALWARSAALFSAARASRAADRLLVQASAAALFSPPADPHLIARRLHDLFPTRDLDAVHIAVLVSPPEPHALARLRLLFETVQGVTQIPTQIHLLLLAPETCTRTESDTRQLADFFTSFHNRSIDCRDLVWLREQEAAGPGGRKLLDSTLRSATRPLWVRDGDGRQAMAILAGLEHPHRDSVACRLFFDRPGWIAFASADLTIRLTRFLLEPPAPRDREMAALWLQQAQLPSQTDPGPALDAAPPRFQRPEDPLHSEETGLFARSFGQFLDHIRNSRGVLLAAKRRELETRVKGALHLTVSGLAKDEPDELHALVRACHWHAFLENALAALHATCPTHGDGFLRTWLAACNELFLNIPALSAPEAFALAAPDLWPTQLAQLMPRASVFLTPPEGALPGVEFCAATWICDLLPRLLDHAVGVDDMWAEIAKPIQHAIAAHDAAFEAIRREFRDESASQEQTPPEGLVPGLLFNAFRRPALRRQQRASAAEHTARFAALCDGVDRLFTLAERLMLLAAHQEMHLQVQAAEQDFFEHWFEPLLRLRGRFATSRTSAENLVASTPEEPPETIDSLGLLARPQLAALATEVCEEPDAWKAAARKSLTEQSPPWDAVAQACEASLGDWVHTLATAHPVTPAWLIGKRFPEIRPVRTSRVITIADRLLLPLRPRNASRRRIHQEWLLPTDVEEKDRAHFELSLVSNLKLCTAPVSCGTLPERDADCLDLLVHLLGFDPADYIHWKLLPADVAASRLPPLSPNPDNAADAPPGNVP